MALLNQSVQVTGQVPKFFETLRQGQAPDKFSRAFLKDIGFASSNYLAFIPLLKGLGFLTPDGTPTQRYRDFLDPTQSGRIIAEAIKEAYSDIFIIKSQPTKSDRKAITGKYKSAFNLSEVGAERAASTFLALLELADEKVLYAAKSQNQSAAAEPKEVPISPEVLPPGVASNPQSLVSVPRDLKLHYNIQIHLPATKDVEVYNAIFKSLREHLID
ncbi:MAG: DUF5343 domain-containing protein [Phenylobacterium sp.]|uniref:DUF5343 domain-containing protein n=1 Tax=Phenylobacterium sp. TaxID=1871053 RepID=UPI0027308D2D|nr:DUF5343 domain-containing protein [Phenylobacterium sp.]MDP2008905.1 DUF5343 domain-containing protein [Phenylobacterium sp.]